MRYYILGLGPHPGPSVVTPHDLPLGLALMAIGSKRGGSLWVLEPVGAVAGVFLPPEVCRFGDPKQSGFRTGFYFPLRVSTATQNLHYNFFSNTL